MSDEYERNEEGRDRARGERSDRGDRRPGMKPNYFLPKPVKVGDELDLTIEATASKGDGNSKERRLRSFCKRCKTRRSGQGKNN